MEEERTPLLRSHSNLATARERAQREESRYGEGESGGALSPENHEDSLQGICICLHSTPTNTQSIEVSFRGARISCRRVPRPPGI